MFVKAGSAMQVVCCLARAIIIRQMYETVPMELYTCGKHFQEQPIGDLPSGYLLAMKDLCLLRLYS